MTVRTDEGSARERSDLGFPDSSAGIIKTIEYLQTRLTPSFRTTSRRSVQQQSSVPTEAKSIARIPEDVPGILNRRLELRLSLEL